MKKVLLFLILTIGVFALPPDYVNSRMSSMFAQNGQMFRDDGTIVNIVNNDLNNVPFEYQISVGKYDSWFKINKFGINPLITTASDPEDCWSYGGLYTFTAEPGEDYYVSSSSAADTQNTIFTATTIDSNGNWNRETWTQDLVGQTKTLLTPPSGDPCIRFSRAENNDSTDYAGDIYIYEDDTVIAGVPQTPSLVRGHITNIPDANNQTLQTIETIPTGYVGFFVKGEGGLNFSGTARAGTQFATLVYHSRRYGKVFATKKHVSVVNNGSSHYEEIRSFPDPLPAKTDIKVQIREVSDDMGVFGAFDILLIPEEEFTDTFLDSIGQIRRVE